MSRSSRRHHLGVDQVVAVGAHAGERSESVSLAGAASTVPSTMVWSVRHGGVTPGVCGVTPGVGVAAGRAPRVDASRPHAHTSSSSARASGGCRPRSNCSGVTKSASERRSILRRWPKPARTRANSRPRSTCRHRRPLPPARSPRAPTPPSGGAGTPSAARRPTMRAVGPVGDLHGHRAVGGRAGPATKRSPTSRCTITSMRCTWPERRRADRPRAAWPCCRGGWRRAPPPSSREHVVPVELGGRRRR